jgi:flagellar L-ring protein FlgH
MRIVMLLTLALATSATFAQTPVRVTARSVDDNSVLREPPTPAQRMRDARGSLLRATIAAQDDYGKADLKNVSFFYVPEPEPRVLKKHDLITIIIREQSTAKSSGKSEATREASIDAKLAEFLKLNLKNWELEGGAEGATPPGVQFDYKRERQGDAKVDRSDTLSDRIQARVVDVKPNDTVVIEAKRTIKNDDEEQTVLLSGVCRAEDITGDNTVISSQLSDLQITRTHKGAIRDATRRGWLTRIFDAVDPF